ncbi:PAS domain S-box-containing protein [Motilibacter rhizosphaerae]|uniref:PAS domain S-box-containing protein n=1 Tax=Motilibacter rhizosphaerae TaxID=598652 RepID=A0A4Q7NVU7_9ACTN|nr:SpoIIE family protein phosphatase [Motilibacter rhizosphaerae]RZS91274.1 PAS domain S-box-containing protein [Motilibacter rhizosphaerae]
MTAPASDRPGTACEEQEFPVVPESVPAARRLVREVLAAWDRTAVEDSSALVVTELVTNAVLHARGPVRLVLEPYAAAGVRIEVHDGSPAMPLRPIADAGSTTGRGLSLVESLAEAWAAEPTPRGKRVWVHLVPGTEPDDADFGLHPAGLGELGVDDLESWADLLEEVAPERYSVTLGDVPTDLLLAAKAHVDSLVRELTLTAGGAASGVTGALPEHLAGLISDVVQEFAEARHAIKRQALAAAGRGEPRTTLTLTLPTSAADAGERYLAALEEADRYAHTARLLTLAAPPQHQVFRRWYVTSLVSALRSHAAGEQPPPVPSFESFLLGAVDVLAGLQRASALAAHLHDATQRLSAAGGLDDVARAVLDAAARELDATGGALLLADGRHLRPLATQGDAEAYAGRIPTAGAGAAAVAHRDRTPVWLESNEDRAGEPGAVCGLPLLVAGHSIGALELEFADSRLFSTDERAFLTALAAIGAQTLDRVRLDSSRTQVVHRLTRLQAVTTALGQVRDVEAVLDVALSHAGGLVGAFVAAVTLLDDDGRTLRLARVAPGLPAEFAAPTAYGIDEPLPVAEALRRQQPVWVGSVAERDELFPRLRGLDWGPHGLAVIPLVVEDVVLGALTLGFASPGARLPEPSWEFLSAFADTCAQALDRARSAERVEAANRKLAFLADVTDLLGDTVDVERSLGGVSRLAVPELADLCVFHLLEDGELRALDVQSVDAEGAAAARRFNQTWPARMGDLQGIGRVVREREPLLVPVVPVPEPDDPRAAAVAELGVGSLLSVPLVARGRTIGAMTLVTTGSARSYTAVDLQFAQDLARRIAVGVDNARLFAALGAVSSGSAFGTPGPEQDAGRLAGVLETLAAAFFRVDTEGRFAYLNLQAEQLLLRRREELLGRRVRDVLPELVGTVFAEQYATAARTGRPVSFEAEYAPFGSWLEVRATPDPEGMSVFVQRIDERKAVEAERERANARLRTAAAASAALSALLDPEQVIDRLLDLVVPRLAPYAAVALRADLADALDVRTSRSRQGDVRVVAVRHADRAEEEPLSSLLRALPLRTTDAAGAGAVTGTGRPQERPVTEELLRRVAGGDEAAYAALRATGATSAWTVPLVSRGRTLGALSLAEAGAGTLDRDLLADLAVRAAVALDNALLYRSERRNGIELQRHLLPRVTPQRADLQIATRYLPSVQGALTGGDFYEAVEVGDGLLVALGDVVGHGMRSAARMGQLRAITAALALQGLSPGTLLERMAADVDKMLDLGLATLLVGSYDPQGRRLTLASAGHPPPLLLAPDGTATWIEVEPGPPVGVGTGAYPEVVVDLPAHATVVMFTDGLVERRDESLTVGLERLRRALEGASSDPQELADALLLATDRSLGGDDDVALLVLHHH